MRGDSRRCLCWADNSSGRGQDSDHAGQVSDDDDDDDTDTDVRPGTEEAGAGTLQMWRIVARETGVRGNKQITRPEKQTHTLCFNSINQACLLVWCPELPGYLLEGRCSLGSMRR